MAEELSSQAEQLRTTMSFFALSDGATARQLPEQTGGHRVGAASSGPVRIETTGAQAGRQQKPQARPTSSEQPQPRRNAPETGIALADAKVADNGNADDDFESF